MMTRRWRHGGYALRHDAVDAERSEAERACHAIAATRREETERRETQGWRDAPDGAELFAEGSDARNELKRLEAWLQTKEFRVKVDDERWRFPTRAAPPASSLLERRFVVAITSGAQKTLVPCAGGESTRELLDEVLEKLRDRSERPTSISRAGPPPLPPHLPQDRRPSNMRHQKR